MSEDENKGCPFYKWNGKWIRGLEPQRVLPSFDILLGRYAWAQTGHDGPQGPMLDKGLTLELKDPSQEVSLSNIGGHLGGLVYGGDILKVEKSKDKDGVEFLSLEVTGEIENDEHDKDEPGGRFWKLYVSDVWDENGLPFVEVSEDGGSQFAFGKHQQEGRPVGFSDAEKERIHWLDTGCTSLDSSAYWKERIAILGGLLDDGPRRGPGDHWGTPTFKQDGRRVEGLEPRPTVPPIDTLLGRYSWAETGFEESTGPLPQRGIYLKRSDPADSSSKICGYLGGLFHGGDVLGAEKKKAENGMEYWELRVSGEIYEDEEYFEGSDDYYADWKLIVGKEVDDNGFPFIELYNEHDFRYGRGPPPSFGIGKRQIDGQRPTGFTEGEKARIGFKTTAEFYARCKGSTSDQEEEEEERIERAVGSSKAKTISSVVRKQVETINTKPRPSQPTSLASRLSTVSSSKNPPPQLTKRERQRQNFIARYSGDKEEAAKIFQKQIDDRNRRRRENKAKKKQNNAQFGPVNPSVSNTNGGPVASSATSTIVKQEQTIHIIQNLGVGVKMEPQEISLSDRRLKRPRDEDNVSSPLKRIKLEY